MRVEKHFIRGKPSLGTDISRANFRSLNLRKARILLQVPYVVLYACIQSLFRYI